MNYNAGLRKKLSVFAKSSGHHIITTRFLNLKTSEHYTRQLSDTQRLAGVSSVGLVCDEGSRFVLFFVDAVAAPFLSLVLQS